MTLTTISGKRVIKGFELNDPFPLLVEDSADIIKFFKNSKIVPYSYTESGTGNSLRPLLSKISRLSHTQNACITKKVELGFTGSLSLYYSDLYSDFDTTKSVDYNRYREASQYIMYGKRGVLDYFQDVARNYLIYGECFVELSIVKSGDKYILNNRIMPTEGSYLYKDNDIYYTYLPTLKENSDITLYPFYPNFVEVEGRMISILHIKNGNYLYGEPDSFGSIYKQYNEVQLSVYNNKQTDNNFMGVTILEVEGDNPETGISLTNESYDYKHGETVNIPKQSLASRFVDATTNKGKAPQSIIYMERPADSTPMKVHTVAPVTNEGYFKTLAELNKDAIIMSHRLSRLILGFEQATGWNKDAFKDNILITMETVIANLQKKILAQHDDVVSELNMMNGYSDLAGVNRKILNPIVKLFSEENID